jgi:ribonucleotide monophosphatase NagD (HAD superfamily)
LNQLGFTSIQYQHVLTSGSLTRTLLEKEKLRPFFLVDKSLEIEFEGLSRENPNAIIVGLAPEHFHYEKVWAITYNRTTFYGIRMCSSMKHFVF